MFCTNCGQKNKDDSNFCKRCGSPLESIDNEKVLEQNNSTFSNANNTNINMPPFKESKNINKKNGKTDVITNIAIIAITICIISAIIIFIINSYSIDENQLYNERMTLVYNDENTLNSILKKLNKNDWDETIHTCDEAIELCNKDIEHLSQLNTSITNDTRKEYIKLCIDDLKYVSDEIEIVKEMAETFKRYNNNEITRNEVDTMFSDGDPKMDVAYKQAQYTEDKIKEYEEKYPFVLINGTKSMHKVIKNTL